MPPKKGAAKAGSAASKSKGTTDAVLQQDEGIQAIVLLDSPDQRLDPLTTEMPKALLSVAGVPLLEYTLEFLTTNNVSEILLFTVKHSAEIRAYLAKSRWEHHVHAPGAAQDAGKKVASPSIRVLSSSMDGPSAGDALRAIDGMGVLRHEKADRSPATFFLLDGPVVSNLNLAAAVAAHEKRFKVDPAAAASITLTSVLRQSDPVAPGAKSPANGKEFAAATVAGAALPLDTVTVHTIDPNDGRLWDYQIMPTVQHKGVNADGPAPIASEPWVPKDVRPRLRARADLIETGIYICSPQVIVHFSDNHDYHSVGQDYIRNEMTNIESMGWRFHTHVVSDGYASGICDFRGYSSVTRDVMAGWCYPLLPTSGWHSRAMDVLPSWRSISEGASHVQDGAVVDASAVISGGSLILSGAKVGAGALITNSIVGAGAVVEAGAKISNSIVFASATIGSKVVIDDSIISEKSIIGAGCVIAAGGVIGSAVKIAASSKLDACTRVTTIAYEGPFGLSSGAKPRRLTTPQGSDASIVGKDGVGRQWPKAGEIDAGDGDEDEDDEESDDDDDEVAPVAPILDSLRSAIATRTAVLRSGSAPATAAEQAHAAVAVAAKAALSHPLIAGSAGLPELIAASTLIPNAPALFSVTSAVPTTAAAAASAPAASVAASPPTAATPTSSSTAVPSKPAAGHATLAQFARGVSDLFLAGGKPNPSIINNIAMEVKAYNFSENKTFSDCLSVLVPLILNLVPSQPKVTPGALKATLTAWSPLLKKFKKSGDALDENLAVVEAVAAFVTGVATASTSGALAGAALDAHLKQWMDLFGVILLFLEEGEGTTAEAIQVWAEDAGDAVAAEAELAAEHGDDSGAAARDDADGDGDDVHAEVATADKKALLSSKNFVQLLESLEDDEEEEDEEEEDEEGDGDEEDDECGDVDVNSRNFPVPAAAEGSAPVRAAEERSLSIS